MNNCSLANTGGFANRFSPPPGYEGNNTTCNNSPTANGASSKVSLGCGVADRGWSYVGQDTTPPVYYQ
jgi:hypothetical protein